MKHSRRFGKDYVYKLWKKACANLGIEGIDLYGGTKHSTVTAAREMMSPEEIRRYATEHATNAAFDRYLQVDAQKQREASLKVRKSSAIPDRYEETDGPRTQTALIPLKEFESMNKGKILKFER